MTDHFDGTDAFLERHGWQPMAANWWRHAQHGSLSKNDAIGFANKDAKAKAAEPQTATFAPAQVPGTYEWCRAQEHVVVSRVGEEGHCHNPVCTYAPCTCPEAGPPALREAADSFVRVHDLLEPLRLPDDTSLRDCLPGIWPTVGDLRRLVNAVRDHRCRKAKR